MALEFTQAVKRIPIYPAGVGYAHTGPLVRLESNESPYPPLPAIVAAANAALENANRYPDPESSVLRAALSERYGIPTAQITVGNGSCDVLLAAGQALLEPGAELVHAWPSFSVYPQLEAASGARAVRVALDKHERHDLDAMADAITERTRLVIVCNPNNPTSTALELARITEFIAAVPRRVCVMIDEAYCEFNTLDPPDDSIALLSEHENLVLLRTFSKVYGLCGLRVGFALCGSSELPSALKLIRQPFFCNAVAQAAASEALLHPEEVMRERLRALGLSPADSQANFCWFDLPPLHDEADVVRGLAEQGILVRAGSALGKPGALRVSFGTREENARFIEVLGSLL
jgi:histidinol-phosphate aminotransferase